MGTLEVIGGGDTNADVALLDAGKFAKELGISDPAVGGVADGGLFSGSGFSKKLGIANPAAGTSGIDIFGGSGVAVVSVIDSACGPLGGSCAEMEDGGLNGCTCCLVTESGGETELAGIPFVAPGLGKENGSEDMGGSFAVVRSC